ncbi:MAG: isopenicillin N synthase family oxygenase [Ahrensia sp.]|nr:isopenicillin N synthase family oxygenase [Ahrensia sp.]
MIPILNFADFTGADRSRFVSALGEACRGPGFLGLTGHGIDPALIEETFAASRTFFASPDAVKSSVAIENSTHNRGYVAEKSETLDPASGKSDHKEAFNIGLDLAADDPRVVANEPFRGVNLWPQQDGFKDTLNGYFDAVLELGVNLHRAVALDLGLDEDHFTPHFSEPMATLRLLHYPKAPQKAESLGAGAHTDYGALTLLRTDGVAGLQVRKRGGGWIDVPPIDDGFVLNIGDCLMRWTGGVYASTPHRVLPPQQERYSIAFFLDPNPETEIATLPIEGAKTFPTVTAADYLAERLAATYGETTP